MRLRDQRFLSRPISPTDEDEEHASITETHLHPADVRHVEAAHQGWVDQGEPSADRWRFTVTPDSQRIELD